jgi:glycosyltransferase involved in cell wall biosynthesis/GT2 family glycosyltransferase
VKLSVIIPTFRRPANLRRSLDGLLRQSRPADQILVAIRDDDPDSRPVVDGLAGSAPAVTPVSVGLANASEARNRCLEQAIGDVLVMTDDDTVPKPDWLATIHDRFTADPGLGGLGGPDWIEGAVTRLEERPSVVGAVQWFGRRIGNHHLGARAPLPVEWLKGANMSFRRDALAGCRFGRHLRGDAAQFAEDLAISLEVSRAGWGLRYDPAVAVDHFRGDLTAGVDHRTLRDARSLGDACHNETVTMLEHLGPVRRLVFFLWSLIIGTRLLPGAAIAAFLLVSGQHRDPLRRCRLVWRARREGLTTWRAARKERHRTLHPTGVVGVIERIATPDPLRVCIVTHVVSRWDGQGRVNYELARYLLSRGHDVTLVATAVDPWLTRQPGVRWIRIPAPRRLPHPIGWAIFAVIARLRLGATIEGHDIVHVNGAIAPIRADVNTSHFVHATWRRLHPRHGPQTVLEVWHRSVTAVSAACERKAYHNAGRVVAVSESVRQALCQDVAVPTDQVRVIYNGVDPNEFRPRRSQDRPSLRHSLGIPKDGFVLMFVGDAKSPRKNLDLNLEVVARLSDRFHLIVAGDVTGGPYPAMAGRLGVTSRAHFVGTRRDVAGCFQDVDAVICASHYEPASLVLLEAMASGLPVLCSPGIGNATFIADGRNGFLLRGSDAVDQAAAIIATLARDPLLRQRIGHAARETAVELSWSRMGSQYEELYRELLAGRARVPSRGRVDPTAMVNAAGDAG